MWEQNEDAQGPVHWPTQLWEEGSRAKGNSDICEARVVQYILNTEIKSKWSSQEDGSILFSIKISRLISIKTEEKPQFIRQFQQHTYFIIGISLRISPLLRTGTKSDCFLFLHNLQNYSSFTGIHKGPVV